MAEAAVGWAINKLDVLLTGELKLLSGVHKEVEDVKDELESIESFLRDADARLYQENVDGRVRVWVKQVRQVAFRIEDTIDEYVLHLLGRRNQHGYFNNVTGVVKNLKRRHGLASKIKDIKKSIVEIRERSDRYSFDFTSKQGNSDGNGAWHDPRVHSFFVEETEVVGIDSVKAELISILVDGTSENAAISVVGMGGLGKTTLASKVYDSEIVALHFDCKAWITVSQSYNTEELLRTMISQFQREKTLPDLEGINTMREIQLIGKLREYLSQKRYFVVFDDVWRIDLWEYIKNALPDSNKGSRILLTTRNEGAAPSSNESSFYHILKLSPLPKREAYDLFCKKAFQSNGGNCPSELQEVSRAFVDKCEGLPLGIVTIGGLLATKQKSALGWGKLYDGLSSFLANDQRMSNITKILSLSYYDLPCYLKSCFLYLSLFPEDQSISCSRLMRLWIAEGFMEEKHGRTTDEIAEEYLTELIHRSLIQVARYSIDGKARECRIHDLMRDTILSQSRELGFRQVSTENYKSLKGRSRHLSIDDRIKSFVQSSSDCQTRSVILFEVTTELPKSLISSFIENFELLRLLDFEGAPMDCIPKEIGTLWHLRYLSLKYTRVKTLPKSIGKLSNLETLDLRWSLVHDLPVEINSLLKLKYLLAHSSNYDVPYNPNFRRGVKMQGNIGRLKALQKLYLIEVDHDIGLIGELQRMTQLRKVGIKKLRSENGTALCSALEKMTCLETLHVSSVTKEEFLDLQSMSDPPPQLRRLYVNGRVGELPQWIGKLACLVKIHMNWSRLAEDPLAVLQTLPNLLILGFYEGYDGAKLHFKKGWFRKLKQLYLLGLRGLNEIIMDEGTLPVMEKLRIGPCPNLKEVPCGMHLLRNLKSLEFTDIRREIAAAIQQNDGYEYGKIEHIPLVLFWYKIKGENYNCYKLGDSELVERLKGVDELCDIRG
ncbi:disease resistance protein RPM1-like [Mercurialis annua]|uniref:disease resistance protein RPM1-like n=1 Tax=Mercurialis annua TaxID=3986 RepID=UPI00215E95EF|nr:disease resistance protein RPM1-like [Mercurialis annua]